MTLQKGHLAREAVGVFRSEAELQAVIDELLSSGFDRADLSLLASEGIMKGQPSGGADEGEIRQADPDLHTLAFISKDAISEAEGAVFSGFVYVGALAALIPVVVSGGALAAALLAVGLGGGAGAAIGAVLARVIGQHHGAAIEEQLASGGLVLWVRTDSQPEEQRAIAILTKHSGLEVHLHSLPEQHHFPLR